MHKNTFFSLLCLLYSGLIISACTTLGPMPGITALSPVPNDRTGVEIQSGYVPGFYLSDAVQENPNGDIMVQFSGMFDPGEWLPVKGLSMGARYVTGSSSKGIIEPMIRYRRHLDKDQRIATQVTAFGTHASGGSEGASYEATRGGIELSTDIRVTPKFKWIELHVTGGSSLTLISANGSYCSNNNGYGMKCEDGQSADTHTDTFGAYPALFVGSYLDFFRHTDWYIHNLRVGFYMAAGRMPRVRHGKQEDIDQSWHSYGVNVIAGFGAGK
ncbi:MAG TPA: hypothetical protein EYN66_14680 [Myxococcales bacterium]|nr:hypothetical protein [Myxococcales bacterium]